jgi:beta-D-galactosyl-(1->4)-L-rhamnose phosphorylase
MNDLLATCSFTLPGQAGYERLTLELAKKWGADTIRDCEGTELSPEITQAGYDIYSTICLVRSVQSWARDKTEAMSQLRAMNEAMLVPFAHESSGAALSNAETP